MSTGKPERTLIAYCVLADRLRTPGMGIVQAMTPFLAEACHQFAGDLFDASKFSAAVSSRYGITIPRLAALGLTDQLAREGILTVVSGYAASTVYRYAPAPTIREAASSAPVTEAEVESLLQRFVTFCEADQATKGRDAASLQVSFLDRLLHIDSMRLLVRREASLAAKRTPNTIVKKTVATGEAPDADELHLDYLVSQFLLDLRDNDGAAFERVSNVAFANMAAEAIAVFRDPPGGNNALEGLTVYLDSPLLLDMMGVNTEYADYGRELLEAIKASGAKPAVFDHCVAEAEGAIHAQLAYVRSGVNQVATNWGTSAKPDLLAALIDNVGQRAEARLGIDVQRDPEVNLHRRAQSTVGDIEARMSTRMQAWRSVDAKEHDRKSVWAMLAIRDTTSACPRLCDSKSLLLTRNTALVSIANDAWTAWLKGATSHNASVIERWAPVAISDKQFAGYLWTRSGGGDGSISRARLLAHCSAAVRPRADIKARAYNLVLELNGQQEADDLMALLVDREGARALMRATRGDPEDVTPERMPFILERVKLAAGEFAAGAVREESMKQLHTVKTEHERELERLRRESDSQRLVHVAAAQLVEATLLQQQQDAQVLAKQNEALQNALAQGAAVEEARRVRIVSDGIAAGVFLYKCLRWLSALLFGALSGGVALMSSALPAIAAALSVVLAIAGFWFVPDILNGPLERLAIKRMKSVIYDRDPSVVPPSKTPDFRRSYGDGQ